MKLVDNLGLYDVFGAVEIRASPQTMPLFQS